MSEVFIVEFLNFFEHHRHQRTKADPLILVVALVECAREVCFTTVVLLKVMKCLKKKKKKKLVVTAYSLY